MFDSGSTSFLCLQCVSGLVILMILWKLLNSRKKQIFSPKDVVLLYQVGRGPAAPSSSPFPLKLETFLRMYKIPYTNDHTSRFSSKGKTPWMQYNGVSVADSDFCIQFLKKIRNIQDDVLDPNLRATSRAFQKLTEENLYWTMCYAMFVENQDQVKHVMPNYKGWKLKVVLAVLSRVLRLEMWGHGIGRHTGEEIWSIGKEDIDALSNYLGDKQFFLGDHPKQIDCAVFAMLIQIIHHMPGSRHESLVKENYPNIQAYCERMKDRYWPDWKERCYNPSNPQDDMGKIYFL